MQLKLPELDENTSKKKRDRAVAAVRSPDWFKEKAREAIEWCADHHKEFTTDQVWQRFGYLPEGFSLRALGAVMIAAAKDGVIVRTDRVRTTQMKNKHARPLQVWRKAWTNSD
jgi:hypothetical protein